MTHKWGYRISPISFVFSAQWHDEAIRKWGGCSECHAAGRSSNAEGAVIRYASIRETGAKRRITRAWKGRCTGYEQTRRINLNYWQSWGQKLSGTHPIFRTPLCHLRLVLEYGTTPWTPGVLMLRTSKVFLFSVLLIGFNFLCNCIGIGVYRGGSPDPIVNKKSSFCKAIQ